ERLRAALLNDEKRIRPAKTGAAADQVAKRRDAIAEKSEQSDSSRPDCDCDVAGCLQERWFRSRAPRLLFRRRLRETQQSAHAFGKSVVAKRNLSFATHLRAVPDKCDEARIPAGELRGFKRHRFRARRFIERFANGVEVR